MKFLEQRYGFAALAGGAVLVQHRAVPRRTRRFTQQVFVTAEPIAARRAGADPKVFLVADSGYNPYTAVVIMHGETLRSDAAQVAALRGGAARGLAGLPRGPGARRTRAMGPLNPEMDAEAFRLAAEAQGR